MSLSKAKKALRALKERVDTVELNGDMIQRASGEEIYQETVKLKDEIKILVEAYEKQVDNNKILNKKIRSQRVHLRILEMKNKINSKIEPVEILGELLKQLEKEGCKITVDIQQFTDEDNLGLHRFIEPIGSKTVITIAKGKQYNLKRDIFGTIYECSEG